MIHRREFVRQAAFGSLAAQAAAGKRMNVLFIIADQHNASCMHNEGHPQAITPNLDQLAASGVKFTQAISQNPICTPSRMSIFTGQYCHNHGYYGLAGPAPQNHLASFLLHFRRNGYKTAAIGKIHTPDQPSDWLAPHCDLLSSYREHNQFLTGEGVRDKEDSIRLPEFPGNQQNEGRPSNLTYRQSMEGWAVTTAIEFMNGAKDQPFCMEVSLPKPHECYTPAKEFWDMYADDLAMPSTFHNSAEGRPPHFQRMIQVLKNQKWLIEPKTYEAGTRRVWHGYLACITHTDHAVGELLAYLDRTGKAGNTVVIYTADHGAYEGMFGVPEKAPGICSQAVCRVPSIWRVPGVTKAGLVSKQLVESVDIASTIPTLCGLPAMDTTDGHDIVTLLRGEDQPVREVAVTENVWSKSLRWGPWRFVHYQPEMFGKDTGELYNMESDPEETHNLYWDAEHQETVNHCRRLLMEWLIRTTRYRTILPNPGMPPQQALSAEDGTESNKAGVMVRVKRGAVNYI